RGCLVHDGLAATMQQIFTRDHKKSWASRRAGPSWPRYTDAMANAHPLNWKLKLMAEIAPGEHVEIDVATWERPQEVSLATLGWSLEEGKKILAEIQRQMVTTQMEQRAQADRCCANCGRSLRNKGHYRSTFH